MVDSTHNKHNERIPHIFTLNAPSYRTKRCNTLRNRSTQYESPRCIPMGCPREHPSRSNNPKTPRPCFRYFKKTFSVLRELLFKTFQKNTFQARPQIHHLWRNLPSYLRNDPSSWKRRLDRLTSSLPFRPPIQKILPPNNPRSNSKRNCRHITNNWSSFRSGIPALKEFANFQELVQQVHCCFLLQP